MLLLASRVCVFFFIIIILNFKVSFAIEGSFYILAFSTITPTSLIVNHCKITKISKFIGFLLQSLSLT